MLNFHDAEKTILVEQGALVDQKCRDHIKLGLPCQDRLVEATKHVILTGPPGVGKTYGTIDECNKAKQKYINVSAGTSDIALALQVAVGVDSLKDDEELVVILDDADDVMFGSYDRLNKWKIATGDIDYDLGQIPTLNHNVSMVNTISSLTKQKKHKILKAIEKFSSTEHVGLQIPMDRCRVIVLANLDVADPKSYVSKKMAKAAAPVVTRTHEMRIDINWEKQWGWLAYVLSSTQPFPEHELSDDKKIELLNWMYDNWGEQPKLRDTSYRAVRKLAAEMINNPDNYRMAWKTHLRGV